ncbi:UNVERIFIED_CONTAM: hypothetical protein HDU68_007593, partial [Siphonaria sp. JEL0065]
MADILGPVLARQLQEKLYDRRKQAALEVERLVREALVQNNSLRVTALIRCIVEFAYSPAANARNGGLIALAAVAIALGNTLNNHLNTIVPPILACFSDPDIRVRYYACKSMYNVAKVARRDLLVFFNEIFDALSRLVADQDGSVKNGAELLDRLIKDIVCEHAEFVSANWINSINNQPHNSITNNIKPLPAEPAFPAAPGSAPLFPANALATTFNFPRFIPLLSERIKTVNPFTRMFLIQWISTLDAIPFLELVAFLPEFLDGLFLYLSDQNLDVRTAALNLLQEFLREISQSTHHHHGHHQIVGGKNSSSSLYSQMTRGGSQEPQRRRSASTTTDNAGVIVESDNSLAPPNHHHSLQKSTSSPDFEDEPAIRRPISSLSLASAFFADTGGKPTPTTTTTKTTIINNLASAVGIPNTSKSYTSSYPSNSTLTQNLDFSKIMKILLPYLSSNDSETQATALRWTHEFVQTVPPKVIVAFTPGLVGAILPCLSQDRVTPIKHMAIDVNAGLYRLVAEYAVVPVVGGIEGVGNNGKTSSASFGGGGAPLSESFDIAGAVESLTRQFRNEHEETRIASMDWLLMLHKKAPKRVVDSEDVLFQSLLRLLSDTSEDVVKKDLQLLAQISISSDEEYFHRFLVNLLDVFSMDRKLLESRGSLIIRHLCLSLNPERMFRAFAEILERDDDLEFASTMVQNLNIILVTAPELSDLRRRLKNMDTRSSAFATLRNRLSSVSSMVMLYGVNGGSAASVLSGGGVGASVGVSPAVTVRSRAKASSSASSSSGPDLSLKWNELLAHFRNVQNRHERSRRLGTRTGGAAGGSRRRGAASSYSTVGTGTTAISGGTGPSPLSQNLPNRLSRSVSMANSANGNSSEEHHNYDIQQSNSILMAGSSGESGASSIAGHSLQQQHNRIHQLVENNYSLSSLSLDSSNNGSASGGGGGGGGDSLVVTGNER